MGYAVISPLVSRSVIVDFVVLSVKECDPENTLDVFISLHSLDTTIWTYIEGLRILIVEIRIVVLEDGGSHIV